MAAAKIAAALKAKKEAAAEAAGRRAREGKAAGGDPRIMRQTGVSHQLCHHFRGLGAVDCCYSSVFWGRVGGVSLTARTKRPSVLQSR